MISKDNGFMLHQPDLPEGREKWQPLHKPVKKTSTVPSSSSSSSLPHSPSELLQLPAPSSGQGQYTTQPHIDHTQLSPLTSKQILLQGVI